MEAQDFVSKNLLLEKADHDVIVKDTVALRYYNTDDVWLMPSLLRHFSAH
jgi:hypothetical protein